MYDRLYRLWMGAALTCWLTTAMGVTPTRTDLFKPSEKRITQKLNSLMHYARTTNNNIFVALDASIKNALESDTLDALVNLYRDQYATKQVVSAADNAYGTDVSFMILILEKMISVYYCKLDTLESACHYWEWATHHPTAYAASQSPYRWVTGGSFTSEAEHNYAYAQQLRDQYSEEYGVVERLLGAMADEGFINPERWLHDVHAFLTGILTAINPEQSNDDLRVIAQKVVLYEKRIASEVAVVKVPHWIKRNWLTLTAGAVTTGIAAYCCYNNMDAIQNSYHAVEKSLSNFWGNNFATPVNNLKDELKQTLQPMPSIPQGPNLNPAEANAALQDLEKSLKANNLASWTLGTDGIKAFVAWLKSLTNMGYGVATEASGAIARGDQVIKANSLTFRLFEVLFPVIVLKKGYDLTAYTYRWFTKKDRRALR